MSAELTIEDVFSVDTVPPPPGEADAYNARTHLNPPSLALIAMMATDHAACDVLEKRFAPAVQREAGRPVRITPIRAHREAPPRSQRLEVRAVGPVVDAKAEMWLAVGLFVLLTVVGLGSFLV
jgi:hypothetical protein